MCACEYCKRHSILHRIVALLFYVVRSFSRFISSHRVASIAILFSFFFPFLSLSFSSLFFHFFFSNFLRLPVSSHFLLEFKSISLAKALYCLSSCALFASLSHTHSYSRRAASSFSSYFKTKPKDNDFTRRSNI